jgi:hypothetical protein
VNDEHQYPLGTLIAYGPDTRRATKLVASIIPSIDAEPSAIQRWHVKYGDIREDSDTILEVEAFFSAHEIASKIEAPEIFGCEHEEGIDYPLGSFCRKCAMWSALSHAKSHRTGKTLEGNGEFIPAKEVIPALAEVRGCPPAEALAAAEFHREALIEPLIQGAHATMDSAEQGEDFDSQLGCHALFLLAKWREPKGLSAVLRWFSLSEPAQDSFSGDTLLECGAVILASIAGTRPSDIRSLVEDTELYEYSRGVALDALAVQVLWEELPRAELVAYLRELIAGKLERNENMVWNHVATVIADLGLAELVDELRTPYDEGCIDDTYISWTELENLKPRINPHFKRTHEPITDIAKATEWWACYGRSSFTETEDETPDRIFESAPPRAPMPPPTPFIATPKIGRNDQCSCGSGKKYKKCCGAS